MLLLLLLLLLTCFRRPHHPLPGRVPLAPIHFHRREKKPTAAVHNVHGEERRIEPVDVHVVDDVGARAALFTTVHSAGQRWHGEFLPQVSQQCPFLSSVQCPVSSASGRKSDVECRMSNVECLGHRMAPTNRMKCAALKGRVTPSTSINVLLAMWVSSRRLPGSPQSNMDAYKDINALIGHSVTLSWSHTVNLVLVSLFLFLFLFLLSFFWLLFPPSYVHISIIANSNGTLLPHSSHDRDSLS